MSTPTGIATKDHKISAQNTICQSTTEENNVEYRKRYRDCALLYLSACAASLSSFGSAMIMVWTSPVAARLQSNNTDENPLGKAITTIDLSLLGGLPVFGCLCGSLLIKLCDMIGRKKALMCMATVSLISKLILAFATSLPLYFVARFTSGLGVGTAVSTVSIFLSEISEDHNRGSVGCLIGLGFPLGNLYAYIFGPLFSIRNFTLLCSIPFVLQLAAFILFVPESPVYFISKENKEGALKSLKKLRKKSLTAIENEYENIFNSLKQQKQNTGGLKHLLSTRSNRKGLIISIGINTAQQLCGVSAIMAFAAPIFDAADTSISGNSVGVLIGSVKLGSVFLATIIIEKTGRRPLLMTSTMGCGISMFFLGLQFYLKSINSSFIDQIIWLPILAVGLFCISYGIGLGAIPIAIMSELFPNNVRSVAVTIITVISYGLSLAVTVSFPILADLLGEFWCLWIYSICSFAGFIFVYVFVPEIKGKSLLEVQELLSR